MFMKIGKICISILSYILIGLLVMIMVVALFCRINGKTPSVFGYQIYRVVSPSMEPRYNVGDIIIVKKTNDYDEGEDIVYLGTKGSYAGKTVVHNLEKIIENDQGYRTLLTKGINNPTADPLVNENQVIGKVVNKSTILTTVFSVLKTAPGFICIIVLPLSGLLIFQVVSIVKELKKKHE